ncbi:MAG: hypothetical protein JWM46_365 [Candidatus Kaiserbacteria bacterium]|nr:hypothetical protein [Candidatus Kaiserbacteria bacterium]
MPTYLRSWLPLAVAITGLCLAIYASGQQIYRQSLNDPQIQLAEDAVARISGGASASSTIPKTSVDIAGSLAAFMVVYDATGTPLVSSGLLDGRVPVPPAGVFEYAANNSDDRLTLEPEVGVRIAAVVKAIPQGKGFVLVGRNMRVVEARISDLGDLLLAAWIMLMIATFATTVIAKKYLRDHNGYMRISL